MKRIVYYLIICMSTAVYLSCSSDEVKPQDTSPIITPIGKPQGEISSMSIGPGGGSLQSTDGKLTLIVPEGALETNVPLSIRPITNEGPLGVGAGYRLWPEGTVFTKPVTLQFKYDDQMLNNMPADFFWIITQATDGSWNAMLKSVVDPTTKTVSVQTTHFSDWALGRFVDLSLEPSSATLKKGESINLQVAGFVRDKTLTEEDELAPLIPLTTNEETFAPLTPIPNVESRLMDFQVKRWTMNGSIAPVSNSNGSLNGNKKSATYKAPNQKPSTNPVAVSVELSVSKQDGVKSTFMLTSSFTVVDSDLYLLVKIDGETYEYYQYGFNGTIPPDPNNISIANCGLTDNGLGIAGTQFINSSTLLNSFGIEIDKPKEGTKFLSCIYKEGDDDVSFILGIEGGYSMSNTKRTMINQACDVEYDCGDVSVTLFSYTGGSLSDVRGFFSGTLYEDKPGFSNTCTTSIPHSIEGEFWLKLAN